VVSKKASSHPLQAPISQLRTWLSQEFPFISLVEAQPYNATVWLPSYEQSPRQPQNALSPRSGMDHKAASASLGAEARPLTAWQVAGLALTPMTALTLLCHLESDPSQVVGFTVRRRQGAQQRVQHGKDLTFWGHAAKFALEMLVEQSYVPALHSSHDRALYGYWSPVLNDGRLRLEFDQLVEAMPPICRAYNLEHPLTAPAPGRLLEQFITTLVDAAVRQAANQPATQRTENLQTSSRLAESSLAEQAPPHYLSSPAAPAWSQNHALGQWLESLHLQNRRLQLPPQPLFQFYEQWRSWIDQLYATADAVVRVCFVVQSPQPSFAAYAAPEWRLHYELQACDNPALRVSAHEIWHAKRTSLRIGNRRIESPQERLLAGLGSASRHFPAIARSLQNPHPESATLSPLEAYRFLREVAPLLEQIGFGVAYPEWWSSSQRTQLGLRLRLASLDAEQSFSALSPTESGQQTAAPTFKSTRLGDVEYSWELTMGNKRLSLADFERMAAMNTPLFWHDGDWVEIDPKQVSEVQRFVLQRPSVGRLSFLQTLRLLQGVQEQPDETSQSVAFVDRPIPPLRLDPIYLPADIPELLPNCAFTSRPAPWPNRQVLSAHYAPINSVASAGWNS
jgi:hypothetical protein